MLFKFQPLKSIIGALRVSIGLIVVVTVLFLLSRRDFPDLDILFTVVLVSQIPDFIIFLQYYTNDYKADFVFEKSNNRIVYRKKNKTYTYTFDEIKQVVLTAPASRLKKKGIQMFTKDRFFYYKFIFKDGKTIILTSLMFDGQLINETNFKDMDFRKEPAFFPFLINLVN